ncbi:heterotrimeric G protein alpha subunit [Mycena leptocephala]|nr:heterotrimeric G protein alpha subunit [Mycena leptocephala]
MLQIQIYFSGDEDDANEGRAEKARSDAIDRRIREDRKRFQKEHKILVLGTSQSGKSTIVKQMKIVYQGGLDVRERAEYRTTIYKNVLDWAGTLARVVERVGVDSLPEKTHVVLSPALADAVWHIWRALAVDRVVDEHPTELYPMDSAEYFLSSIHRIAAPTYVPSEEDILHTRTGTNMMETRFFMGDLPIYLFDAGGLRFECKKWMHCFDSVTSLIFCVALSDYDQVLEEEKRVNRMRESLYLFESVVNSRWFLRTSVILFLTKFELFKEKLPRIPLAHHFPEYSGGNDLQKAVKYILWKFLQENRARLAVYPHLTQATDTKHIHLVSAAVKATIQRNARKNIGLGYAAGFYDQGRPKDN